MSSSNVDNTESVTTSTTELESPKRKRSRKRSRPFLKEHLDWWLPRSPELQQLQFKLTETMVVSERIDRLCKAYKESGHRMKFTRWLACNPETVTRLTSTPPEYVNNLISHISDYVDEKANIRSLNIELSCNYADLIAAVSQPNIRSCFSAPKPVEDSVWGPQAGSNFKGGFLPHFQTPDVAVVLVRDAAGKITYRAFVRRMRCLLTGEAALFLYDVYGVGSSVTKSIVFDTIVKALASVTPVAIDTMSLGTLDKGLSLRRTERCSPLYVFRNLLPPSKDARCWVSATPKRAAVEYDDASFITKKVSYHGKQWSCFWNASTSLRIITRRTDEHAAV